MSEGIAAYYPECRRLETAENSAVKQMLTARVAPRTIAAAINASRQATGHKGIVIPKDIFNKATQMRKEKRQGREEHQILREYLEQLRQKDPNGVYDVSVADDDAKTLQMVYVQTDRMRTTFQHNPQVTFIDSTYRINMEHYSLYAILVQDENGFGQPAACALLQNEKAETLRLFFQFFKANNAHWDNNVTVYVDRDFTQLAVLNEEFPDATVLICAFHAMKAMKFNIAKEKLHVEEKQQLLTAFKQVMYARTCEEAEEKSRVFITKCPPTLAAYYTNNWSNCREM